MKPYTSTYKQLLTVLAISVFGSVLASDTNGSYPPARRLLPAAWKASWAPDSKKIAFGRHTSKRIEAQEGISVLDLESGTVTNLTEEGKDPAWSPDGKFIAYVAQVDNRTKSAVLVIPARGGEPVRLNGTHWPMWTPDSKRVLSFPPISPRPHKIFSMALDAPEEEPAVFFTVQADSASDCPAISPDGSRLAVCLLSPTNGLFVYDTKTEQTFAHLPGPVYFAGWSPDGRQVAVGGLRSEWPGLWIYDVARSGAYQVATNGTRPAWSPDGKQLVYDVWSGSLGRTNWTKELWVIETATLPRSPTLTNQLPPRVLR